MSSESFQAFSEFAGGRIKDNKELETACRVLDDLRCRDLLSLLTFMSQERAKQVKKEEIIKGNRFHEPSPISQRDFHLIDKIIFEQFPDLKFVELSPLQPFGINTFLTGLNEKNIVASLRRSEVNADATTALFRIAMNEYNLNPSKNIHLATNAHVTRSQIYNPNSKFRPHFKVFAQVTVGKQPYKHSNEELEVLANHLSSESKTIRAFSENEKFSINDIKVTLSNTLFIYDLVDRGLVDLDVIRKHTTDQDFNILEWAGFEGPKSIPLSTLSSEEPLKRFGFKKGIQVVQKFCDQLAKYDANLFEKSELDLSRIAGVGYYKNLCYRVQAKNNDGLVLPLVDGGTTKWAENYGDDKNLFSVTSGIGTELLALAFMRN